MRARASADTAEFLARSRPKRRPRPEVAHGGIDEGPVSRGSARWLAAGVTPLAAGFALAWFVVRPELPHLRHPTRLVPIQTASPRLLAAVFARYGYRWPPTGPVPALEVPRLPPALADLEPETKKRLFLRLLLPLVMASNNRIRLERAQAREILDEDPGNAARRLRKLARRYRISAPLDSTRGRAELLRRCDVVPAGLVLAQAAKESGWGTSNYARSRNNLFGMRTWRRSRGTTDGSGGRLVADIKAYPGLLQSVDDYLYNLNVSPAYGEFRIIRNQARAAGRAPDLTRLAAALNRYSERGRLYTQRLARLIRENGLERLPKLWLSIPPVVAPPASSAKQLGQGVSRAVPATDPSSPMQAH